MKKIIFFLLSISFSFSYSQSGTKWATSGNGIGSGDFVGTTNNFPLLFHTNGSLRMTIGTNGSLNLNSFNGTGNRVLLTDANGNLFALPQGTTGQFLQGDGTWGNLPAGAGSWGVSGNNIFNTNSGFIGIGTNNPQHLLDINGNVHIQNNLYVDGQILITDRVQSGTISTDTVRANTGSVIIGDTKIINKFEVGGNSSFGGNLQVSSLAGIGDRVVVVDATGILKIAPSFPSGSCFFNAPQWHLGGDNILPIINTTPNDGSIGTCDGADFILKSNNARRIWIKPTGDLGFGISTPSEKFHFSGGNLRIDGTIGSLPVPVQPYNKAIIVNGDAVFANYVPASATGSSDNGINGFEIIGDDDGTGNKKPTRRGISVDANPNGNVNFYVNSNQTPSSFKFKNGAVNLDLMTLDIQGKMSLTAYAADAIQVKDFVNANTTTFLVKTDGSTHLGKNVQIGFANSAIQNAGAALNINASNIGLVSTTTHSGPFGYNIQAIVNQNSTKTFVVGNVTSTYKEPFIVFGSGVTNLSIDPAVSADAFLINNQTANKTTFKVGTSGAVEINMQSSLTGTNAPSAIAVKDLANTTNFKVFSSGSVYAKEVTIQTTTFPDYVFAKSYKRLSIPEMDNFISNNKHLPGFEKADHYVKNGINTSEILVKQQETIENLALYIIELEKRIKSLEKTVK